MGRGANASLVQCDRCGRWRYPTASQMTYDDSDGKWTCAYVNAETGLCLNKNEFRRLKRGYTTGRRWGHARE